jgi:integrase
MLLSDYARRWLKARSKRLKPSTLDRYTRTVEQQILPLLGSLSLPSVTRRRVDAWCRAVEGPDIAHSTLCGWYRVLATLLEDAAADHGLPSPTHRVLPPRGGRTKKREQKTLSLDDLRALLDAVKVLAPARHAEAVAMAYTGMRSGEIYALEWKHVDWEARHIDVVLSHVRGVVGSVKTEDPRRVAMHPDLVEILRAHRLTQGLHTRVVFPADGRSKTGYRNGQTLTGPLRAAAERAGIDVRLGPQVLRRTFDTLGLGVDRVVLRSMMGHASEEMTNRYAGVRDETKLAAVKEMFG